MPGVITLNNGIKIPQVGLGVYLTPKDVATSIVYDSLKIGYRHIDTAQYYENEEEVSKGISKWLKETGTKRQDIYYTTKVKHGDAGYDATKKIIQQSLLKAKDIEYIDLFLIHSPYSNREKRLGSWKALQEAVESGKVKSIGVSNYGIQHLKELLEWDGLKIKPTVNQIEVHPWLTREELVKYSKDHGIEIEAYSPLVRAHKFGDKDLVALSEKYKVTEAQILIKWSIQKGYITLPKTVSKERAASNFDVDKFELTKDEVTKLDGKNENFVSTWDPTGFPVDEDYKD